MGRISRKVDTVLVLYDAFTNGLAYKNEMKVTTEQGIKPIIKEKGYYVFLDEANWTDLDLFIESPIYQKKRKHINRLGKTDMVKNESIRLCPDRTYPFPEGTTFLSGKADCYGRTGQLVIILRDEVHPIRLLKDYQKGDKAVSLFGVGGEAEGQEFVIFEAGMAESERMHWTEQNLEIFTLEKQVDHLANGYGLIKALQHTYQRSTSMIRRVYRTEIQPDGFYFAAFREVPGAGTECLVQWEVQGNIQKESVCGLVFGIDNKGPGNEKTKG